MSIFDEFLDRLTEPGDTPLLGSGWCANGPGAHHSWGPRARNVVRAVRRRAPPNSQKGGRAVGESELIVPNSTRFVAAAIRRFAAML